MKKILVAFSGGIDSTISIKYLKKIGYTVEAVFFEFAKTDPIEIQRIQEIAAELKIKLYIKNISKKFEKEVIQYFLNEYKIGRTPNPCIICNQIIKFPEIISVANENNINFIATGHYAQIKKNENSYELYRGKNSKKDQSYFLYRLDQSILARTVFPLGEIESKQEIKNEIQNDNLKKYFKNIGESQDICFLKNQKLEIFLRNNLPQNFFKPGNIISQNKKKLGEHKGLVGYTIGQRKGLGIGGNGPWVVINFDFEKNNLIVGREIECSQKTLIAQNLNWINNPPKKNQKLQAQIRFRSIPKDVIIKKINEKNIEIEFENPEKAITPGQSIVLYDQKKIIGGGIIVNL